MRIRVGFALVLVGLPPISAQVLAGQGAEWISAAEKKGAFDATSFVSVVTNVQRVVRAEWRVSGLGVFQAFVNGREIGRFLKPSFTHVRKCRHVYAKDVTDKLKTAAGSLQGHERVGRCGHGRSISSVEALRGQSGRGGELGGDGAVSRLPRPQRRTSHEQVRRLAFVRKQRRAGQETAGGCVFLVGRADDGGDG